MYLTADSQVTLSATARSGYTISWDPSEDADTNTDGHQVDLAEGYNSIFISVDHDLGINRFDYEVIVKRLGAMEHLNSPATGSPTISGTAQVGEMLTADTTGITDDDGLVNATYSYQWLADDTEIASANEGTYVLTTSEMDKTIKVRVSFTDDGGNEETLTSAATGAVSPAVQQQQSSNILATGSPTISGTAQVGETLTADTSGIADDDGVSGATFSYQWIRNDGSSDREITDATDSTYTLVAADESKTIKVRVSFTDDAANEETLTSTATEAVSFAVQQQIANKPSHGSADNQRHGPGWRDSNGRDVEHLRRGWDGQCHFRLPMDFKRRNNGYRHHGRTKLNLRHKTLGFG